MVKCWNCKHLMTIYRGKPVNGKLFEEELYQCKVKGTIFKRHEITKERECRECEETSRIKL